MKGYSDQKMKLTPPLSYYGGKQRMLKHILPLVPEHKLFFEGCVGGGALFWAKKPSNIEVLNDLNQEVVNFYKVLQNEITALRKLVRCTLHSRCVYEDANVIYKNPHLFSDAQRAWAFWIRCNQSFSAKLDASWGYTKKGDGNKASTTISNKKNRLLNEDFYKDRLSKVTIESRDVVEAAMRFDTADTFHYFDPPYPMSDQGHYKGYEMGQFLKLVDLIPKLKGKVLLSSYQYPELLQRVEEYGWYQQTFEKSVSVNHHSKKKVEVLTANYKI